MSEAKEKGAVIYACMPCYGPPQAGSARQFWANSILPGSKRAKEKRVMDDRGSSLLAASFNHHWTTALNMQIDGVPIERFVMLHNDIIPQDGWMDGLLEELDACGADLLSVVVPIKDGRGLSSTAVHDPNDEWDVLRRLTQKEINALPETFTARDFGYDHRHPLLANTGCWACRMDRPWRWRVKFEIKDDVQFQTDAGEWLRPEQALRWENGQEVCRKDGRWRSRSIPEDWHFSKQLYRLGAVVKCTRKIKVSHIGYAPFESSQVWGQEIDQTLAHKFAKDVPMSEMKLKPTTTQEGQSLSTPTAESITKERG